MAEDFDLERLKVTAEELAKLCGGLNPVLQFRHKKTDSLQNTFARIYTSNGDVWVSGLSPIVPVQVESPADYDAALDRAVAVSHVSAVEDLIFLLVKDLLSPPPVPASFEGPFELCSCETK